MDNNWIEIKVGGLPELIEGMPFSHHVLCATIDLVFIGYYLEDDVDGNVWADAFDKDRSNERVTHWQPLPKNPHRI